MLLTVRAGWQYLPTAGRLPTFRDRHMKLILLTLLALTFAIQTTTSARTFRQTKHPAFTLVSRITTTTEDGTQKITEAGRYVFSDGSIRYIRKNEGGSVSSDYLFEAGRNGLFIKHDERKLVKSWGTPSEASNEPLPTAERLRANPNFLRTEEVLGYTTYVIRDMGSGIGSGGGRPADAPYSELYFVPELGRTPLKA